MRISPENLATFEKKKKFISLFGTGPCIEQKIAIQLATFAVKYISSLAKLKCDKNKQTNFISASQPYMYKKKQTYNYLKTMTNKQ